MPDIIEIASLILPAILLLLSAGVIYMFIRIKLANRLLNLRTGELDNINSKLEDSISQLRQLNLTKDNFFYLLAHELKHPFNDLLEFSRVLIEEANQMEEAELQENIEILWHSSHNLYSLLDNLLNWSAARSGDLSYLIEKTDLVDIISTEIRSGRINAERKHINIDVNLPAELIIYSDRLILSIVIGSLIDNAIKFTPAGRTVEISARKDSSKIIVEIDDSAPEIHEDIQKTIFTTDNCTGTGETLIKEGKRPGMILCSEILRKIGGEIGIKRQRDKGNRFWVTLPPVRDLNAKLPQPGIKPDRKHKPR